MANQMNKQSIYASLLLIAKEGASKKEVAKTLSISNQQLRRLTAELVDKGMLRLDAKGKLVTTDKGHIFLQHNEGSL
jgi:predicted transcriptional regulator